jgi:DNA mismatch endonuclease (patch repair protein)
MNGRPSDSTPERLASSRPSYKGLQPASARATSAARGSSKKTNTRCEVTLRRALWAAGCRYRKNVPDLPGRPDIVFLGVRVAVFCDGDFWHGRDWETRRLKLGRGTNSAYWLAKIQGNIERDQRNTRQLQEIGWTVLRFWESEIRSDPATVVRTVLEAYRPNGTSPFPDLDTGHRHGVKKA